MNGFDCRTHQFAATIISIVPLLVLYLFTQRFFVESADRVKIAGE